MLQLLRVRHLIVVAVVLAAMGAVYGAMQTTRGLRGAMNDAVLASADYRAPIVDIEALLFGGPRLTMEDRIRLADALDELRRNLDARGGTNLAKFSAHELGTLASMSRGLGDLHGEDLDRVRQNWMRIRSNTFDDASWFRFSESDPAAEREAPSLALGAADQATLTKLLGVLDEVENTVVRGERDCERLGEPGPDAYSWDAERGRAFATTWSDWGASWARELESLRGRLPAEPPAESPATLRFVHSAATRALDELAGIPQDHSDPWRTPLRVNWTRRFENARKQVRDARFWSDRARKGLGV